MARDGEHGGATAAAEEAPETIAGTSAGDQSLELAPGSPSTSTQVSPSSPNLYIKSRPSSEIYDRDLLFNYGTVSSRPPGTANTADTNTGISTPPSTVQAASTSAPLAKRVSVASSSAGLGGPFATPPSSSPRFNLEHELSHELSHEYSREHSRFVEDLPEFRPWHLVYPTSPHRPNSSRLLRSAAESFQRRRRSNATPPRTPRARDTSSNPNSVDNDPHAKAAARRAAARRKKANSNSSRARKWRLFHWLFRRPPLGSNGTPFSSLPSTPASGMTSPRPREVTMADPLNSQRVDPSITDTPPLQAHRPSVIFIPPEPLEPAPSTLRHRRTPSQRRSTAPSNRLSQAQSTFSTGPIANTALSRRPSKLQKRPPKSLASQASTQGSSGGEEYMRTARLSSYSEWRRSMVVQVSADVSRRSSQRSRRSGAPLVNPQDREGAHLDRFLRLPLDKEQQRCLHIRKSREKYTLDGRNKRLLDGREMSCARSCAGRMSGIMTNEEMAIEMRSLEGEAIRGD